MRVILYSSLIVFGLISTANSFSYTNKEKIAFLKNIDEGSAAYDANKRKLQAELDKQNRQINKDELDAASREFIDKISQIKTYSADFTQAEKNADNTKQLAGKLKLARPGKFFWTITSPTQEKQSYITNGTKFWHYDIGLQQVVVDNFNLKKIAHSPFYILLDDVYNIATQYDIKKLSDNEYLLNPKKDNKQDNYISNLNILFENVKSKAIKKISFTAGNKTIIIGLSNSTINSSLGNNSFNFVPPKGVDVISADEIL